MLHHGPGLGPCQSWHILHFMVSWLLWYFLDCIFDLNWFINLDFGLFKLHCIILQLLLSKLTIAALEALYYLRVFLNV